MKLSVIAAVSENGVIGRDNALPWRLPADLGRFKALTMGHSIIMGRKTWESIGRALPGRRSIVLTRDRARALPGAETASSLDLALPRAQRVYLTRVHARIDGDVHFPEGVLDGFRLAGDERHEPDGKNPYPYSFQVYEKK
jgi:dihydrofolate reductase